LAALLSLGPRTFFLRRSVLRLHYQQPVGIGAVSGTACYSTKSYSRTRAVYAYSEHTNMTQAELACLRLI